MIGKNLTYADQKVYDFLVKYKLENNGNSPDVREIMAAIGSNSSSYVSYILDKLEDFEMISRKRDLARAITVNCLKIVRERIQ